MATVALALSSAQAAQPLDNSPAAKANRAATRSVNFHSAVSLAKTGNVAGAEAALLQDNVQQLNSLERDIESASKLAFLALTLVEQYDPVRARTTADRALAILTDGLATRAAAATPDLRAQAYETEAFIYDRVYFDRALAKAALAQAQLLVPNSPSVAAGLARMNDKDNAEKRVRGGKG